MPPATARVALVPPGLRGQALDGARRVVHVPCRIHVLWARDRQVPDS